MAEQSGALLDVPASEEDIEQDEEVVDRPTGLPALIIGASRHVALLAAWLAMSGSLFMSDVLGWPPCLLCWYQRICMYPLALLIPIGILRRDRGLPAYVLPLAVIGASISTYHYLLLKTNWVPEPPCAVGGVPCSIDYLNINGLEFLNVPFLALCAFLIIIFSMVMSMVGGAASAEDEQDAPRRFFNLPNIAAIAIVVLVLGAFVLATQAYS